MLTSTKEFAFLLGISLVWQSSRALLASPPPLSRQYAPSSFLLAGRYALYNDDDAKNSDEPYAVCEERTIDESTTGLTTEELKDEVANWYPTMWKEYEFTSANNSQSFWARETSFGCGRLGSEIWTAAVALGLYLVKESSKVTGKQILELGAGVGLPSLVCQYELGASNVVATDFWDPDEFFSTGGDAPGRSFGENLYFNLCQGKVIKPFDQQTMAQRLDWTDLDSIKAALATFEGGTPDLIVGSDLVYHPEIVEPLISVLVRSFLISALLFWFSYILSNHTSFN